MTEQEYLQQYNIENYDRPSIATDIAVFSVMQEEAENNRKLPEEKLKILLIRRASHPCMNMWALPGGFCRKNEAIEDTARRELKEETGVNDAHLSVVGIEGEVDRDKRGWIISHAFMALIDGRKYEVRGGTDAWEAKWFDFNIEKKELKKDIGKDSAHIENEYVIDLTCDKEHIWARIVEVKEFSGFHERVTYKIQENDGIAFDHSRIILKAMLILKKNAAEFGLMAFDLLPESFTMAQLQNVFEIILDMKLSNFRRKMGDYVIETTETYEDRWTRPASLFKRNLEKFYI